MQCANGGIVELISGAVKSVFGGSEGRFVNSTDSRNKSDRSKWEKQAFSADQI